LLIFIVVIIWIPAFLYIRNFQKDISPQTCMKKIGTSDNFENCDFSSEDLSKVDFRGANLRKANLEYSKLINTNLSGTDLSYSIQTSADFSGANIQDTIFDYVYPWSKTNGITDEMINNMASWKFDPNLGESICSGKQVLHFAKPYKETGTKIHCLTTPKAMILNKEIPIDWIAEDLRNVELVLCESGSYHLIQTCNYYGFLFKQREIKRYQYKQTYILREARTGNIVSQIQHDGSLPENCPLSTISNEEYYGKIDLINNLKLIHWLEPYVTSP
jgi:hypothetical protein